MTSTGKDLKCCCCWRAENNYKQHSRLHSCSKRYVFDHTNPLFEPMSVSDQLQWVMSKKKDEKVKRSDPGGIRLMAHSVPGTATVDEFHRTERMIIINIRIVLYRIPGDYLYYFLFRIRWMIFCFRSSRIGFWEKKIANFKKVRQQLPSTAIRSHQHHNNIKLLLSFVPLLLYVPMRWLSLFVHPHGLICVVWLSWREEGKSRAAQKRESFIGVIEIFLFLLLWHLNKLCYSTQYMTHLDCASPLSLLLLSPQDRRCSPRWKLCCSPSWWHALRPLAPWSLPLPRSSLPQSCWPTERPLSQPLPLPRRHWLPWRHMRTRLINLSSFQARWPFLLWWLPWRWRLLFPFGLDLVPRNRELVNNNANIKWGYYDRKKACYDTRSSELAS